MMGIKDELIKRSLTVMLFADDEEISKQIAKIDEPTTDIRQRMDEKFREILRKEKTVSFKKAITAAIIAAVILVSFSLTAFAFGEEIKGFIIEFFDGFARLTPSDDERDFVDARNISIGYIPDGFSQIRSTGGDSSGLREWSGESGLITITYIQFDGTFFTDTDDTNFTEMEYDGLTLYRTERYGQTTVRWTDGKLVYSLACTGVEWEEMVKIIEGITLTESE